MELLTYSTPNHILAATTASTNYDMAINKPDNQNGISNRQQLISQLNSTPQQWIFAGQNHTTNIQKVIQKDGNSGVFNFNNSIKNVDGLYTFDKNLYLGFVHADCVPIMFYDNESNLIGVIHCGWPGALKEATKIMLTKMIKDENLNPQNLKVIIGPCLEQNSCSIQINAQDCPAYLRRYLTPLNNGLFQINNRAMNYHMLLDSGILPQNISNYNLDTYTNTTTFFSVMRDQTSKRNITFITQK